MAPIVQMVADKKQTVKTCRIRKIRVPTKSLEKANDK